MTGAPLALRPSFVFRPHARASRRIQRCCFASLDQTPLPFLRRPLVEKVGAGPTHEWAAALAQRLDCTVVRILLSILQPSTLFVHCDAIFLCVRQLNSDILILVQNRSWGTQRFQPATAGRNICTIAR